jgi:hypothetical protein
MVMPKSVKNGVPIIGVIFLLLGLFKFINGDSWVVWIILGFLFGGFAIFGSNKSGGAES